MPKRTGTGTTWELVRIISRAKCIRASTIIVDSTTRLKMEVTRGVEIVLDQDSMPCWPGDIRNWFVDWLGNCVDYLLNTVGVLVVPVLDKCILRSEAECAELTLVVLAKEGLLLSRY